MPYIYLIIKDQNITYVESLDIENKYYKLIQPIKRTYNYLPKLVLSPNEKYCIQFNLILLNWAVSIIKWKFYIPVIALY
jgi:hypothetical protein